VDFDTTVSLRASLSCGHLTTATIVLGTYLRRGSFLNRARARLASFDRERCSLASRSASLRKKRNRQQLPPSEAKKFRPRRYHGPSRSCASSLSLSLIEKLDESCRRQEARSPREKNRIFLPPSTTKLRPSSSWSASSAVFTSAQHRGASEEGARPSSRCVACIENSRKRGFSHGIAPRPVLS